MASTSTTTTTTPATKTTTTTAMEAGGELVMMGNQLQPFQHQVAGHSLMFRYGAGTICKALMPQELRVYQTMPETLKPHVPQFKGVIAVNINDLTNDKDCGDDPEAKKRKASLPSILRRLNKIIHYTENIYQFILMENIVEGYQRPCLLDLKLGTKPYAISKHPNKTSETLGLALCGMKVFQSRTGQYVHLDKTAGRLMNENEFRQAVRHFLFNGHHIQRDLIPSFLLRLHQLKTAISQLPTFRFFSSSLLLVYDADDEHVGNGLQQPATRKDAHRSPLSRLNSHDFPTVHKHSSSSSRSEHTKTQHLQVPRRKNSQQAGLAKTDSENCESLRTKRTANTRERKRSFSDEVSGRTMHRCCSCEGDTASSGSTVPSFKRSMESSESGQRTVDVRLVDFGHTTHSGIQEEETVHEGVDSYSLLGLQTLIDIFTQAYAEDSQ